MLSEKTFIAGMTLLQKCYIGWQFDVKDEMQVKLWYNAFKNLSDEKFKEVIQIYYAHNDQPPKCIKNLSDILVDEVVDGEKVKPEQALDYVRNIISNRGGWQFEGRDEIYSDLKKTPALYDTVKEFEGELRNMRSDDTYTADRFRRAYEIRLRAGAIRQVDTALGLKIPEDKKLLPSFLPYEQ